MPLYDPPIAPPKPAVGEPSALRLAEVKTVNEDGTVDVRMVTSRAARFAVPYPRWYAPQPGERVLVQDIDGDPDRPVVVAPLDHRDGRTTGPNLNSPSIPEADSADRTYEHVQSSPAQVWTVTHNLGKYPSTIAFDNDGVEFNGLDIDHISDDQLTITFGAATSGRAICN